MNPENRPLFSVIVPVYKVEKYIHQCLDSILAQSFSDFELILVDDGSPDACGRICDEYAAKDSRIKVIHKENGGLVSARRAGYSISRGSYICSIDSDDYVATDLLEKAAEKISDYSVDAVLFGYEYFNEYSGEKHLPKVGSGLYDGEKMETIRKNLIFGENTSAMIFVALNFPGRILLRTRNILSRIDIVSSYIIHIIFIIPSLYPFARKFSRSG